MGIFPRIRLRSLAGIPLVLACLLGPAAVARADDGALGFVRSQHEQLKALLRQAPSPDRDNQIGNALGQMVDYGAVTQRAFGEPCATELPGCTDHWASLTDAQKGEISGLLRRLVEKNYRKNLSKTLDFDVAYDGASPAGSDTSVHTEAKSKSKPRDPPVLVDYLVHGVSGSYRVIDVVTEGSSLTKTYYDQFHRMLQNPDQGYAYIVRKLNEKISQPD
jgi:phospholipid transport system substrate-binding protein